MRDSLVPARLEFAPDGTPFSGRYGDVYHSVAGGPTQAQHVFIAGNGLPDRWRERSAFTLLETGFGLGLNFMATWLAWRSDAARSAGLEYISVEKHPFSADDLARAHGAWPEFAALSAALCNAWPPLSSGEHRIELEAGRVVLRLVFGDAAEVMGSIDTLVDAIYLDGFSPAKNPDLWSPTLCCQLARLSHAGTTLATWSVAGGVRRALAAAGFELVRCTGFGGKRQMLTGRYAGNAGNGVGTTALFCDEMKKA